MPTVREIVIEWLRQHGYGGLYNPHYECECGCDLADLMEDHTCPAADCRAGVKAPCDCEDEHEYHIRAREATP